MSTRIVNIGVLIIAMYGLVTGASTGSDDMVDTCSKRLNEFLKPMTLFMKIVAELQELSKSNTLFKKTISKTKVKDLDALLSSDSTLFIQCTVEKLQLTGQLSATVTRTCQLKVSPDFEITIIKDEKAKGRVSVELGVNKVSVVSREGIITFCKEVTKCPACNPPSDTDMCLKLTGIVIACLASFICGGVCVLLGLFIYRSINNRRVTQASNTDTRDKKRVGHSNTELQVVDATSKQKSTQKTYESVNDSLDIGTDKTQTEHIYRGLDTSTIQSPSKPHPKKGGSHVPSVNTNAAHLDVYEQTGDLKAAEDDHVYNTLNAYEANSYLNLQDEHNRVTKTMNNITNGDHHILTEHAKHLTETDQPDDDHNYFILRKEEAGHSIENTPTHTEPKQGNETTTNDTSGDHAYVTLERE